MINRMMTALACASALSLSHADVSVISSLQVTLPDGSVLQAPTVQHQPATGILTPYVYKSTLSPSSYHLTYSFLIGTTADAPRLNIIYDPTTQKFGSLYFSNIPRSNPLSIVSCLDSTTQCLQSNIQISIDHKTGYVKLNFLSLIMNGYTDTPKKEVKLSGTLEGYIHHPIETIDDIPKRSFGNLIINQQPTEILYASHSKNPNYSNISYYNILTNRGDTISFHKDTSSSMSRVFLSRTLSKRLGFFSMVDNSNLETSIGDKFHRLAFKNLAIQPNSLNPEQPTQEISGDIRYPTPSLSYIVSPWLASSHTPEINRAYNPVITLSSDGFRTLSENFLTIKLLNNQVYSIAYQPNHSKFTPAYYCQVDIREGCPGVTVSPSGWRVRFDQTPLSWRAAPKGPYGANININLRGNFAFAGR